MRRQNKPSVASSNTAGGNPPGFQNIIQETVMSKSLKLIALVGALAAVSACASKEEEFVVVQPEPISAEPVYTGKFK